MTKRQDTGRNPTIREWAEADRLKDLPPSEQKLHPSSIPADSSRLSHINTYGFLPEFYVDRAFICRKCGKREIWRAVDQKWYYEEVKGHTDATAVECHDCRVAKKTQTIANARGTLRASTARGKPMTTDKSAGRGDMNLEVRLRDVAPGDLPIFYEQQLDPDATRMAAFPARDRAAFDAHWAKNILGNPATITRTIVVDGQVAGNIGSWPQDGGRFLGYWIGREHWGKGVATRALAAFLQIVTERPLHAHVASHNIGSIRVLEKCGFVRESEESPEATGDGIVELLFVLR